VEGARPSTLGFGVDRGRHPVICVQAFVHSL
jgi:hypothetical protein